jgi:hypothetical protein
MSGIEVAGLVFGILPILIEVVKSYSDVADSLHTFRHYSKEVKSISLQLKVQNGIFLNHCRLLIRLVEDDRAAEDMLEDGSDQRWTSKELNDKLNVVLKDSLDLSRSIIEEIKDVVDDMKEEMRKFDNLKAQKKLVSAPFSVVIPTKPNTNSLSTGRIISSCYKTVARSGSDFFQQEQIRKMSGELT